MKKQAIYITKIITVLILALLSGHLSAGNIYAKDNPVALLPEFILKDPVPNPTPFQTDGKNTPTPTPEIYKTDKSWIKFKYHELIAKTAESYDLDPQLIYATIMTESEGNELAYRYEPHLGEASLCMGQILVSTARGLGFKGNPQEIYKPEVCIDLVGKYFRNSLDHYGNLSLQQLARSYNSGSPYGRTVYGYVFRFNSWYYETV